VSYNFNNVNNMDSFGPISDLSFLSKVVERSAADRLGAHFLLCCLPIYLQSISLNGDCPSITRLSERSTTVFDIGAAFVTVDH